jgi:hypothetical protein
MMYSQKLYSGGILPDITLPLVGGGSAALELADKQNFWRLGFIYRGFHCPICHPYLQQLETVEWIRENDYPIRGTLGQNPLQQY